jgi:hypothetical protein
MESRGRLRKPGVRSRVTRRSCTWICALLLCISPTAHAGPRWEYEAGIQTLRTARLGDLPDGLPLSGFATVGARFWDKGRVSGVIALGYDDVGFRTRIDTQDFDNFPDPDRETLRLQALLLPVRLMAELDHGVFVELGPEWHLLLRLSGSSYRHDGSIERVRFVATDDFRRNALALGVGLGLHWRGLGGEPRLVLRWVEGITYEIRSSGDAGMRPHGVQLAVGWTR